MSEPEQQIAKIEKKLQATLEAVQTLASDALDREIELARMLAVGLDTIAKEAAVDTNLLIHVLERQVELRREAGSAAHLMVPCGTVLSTLRLLSGPPK